MKKTDYLIISLVLMLVVSSWSPSLVATGWAAGQTAGKASGEAAPTQASTLVTLTITNPLPKATTVTLTRAKS